MKVCSCGQQITSVNPKARRCSYCWFCKACGVQILHSNKTRIFCGHKCAATWNAKNNPASQRGLEVGRGHVVFDQPGQSRILKRTLPPHCELCGFSRALQMAHITPRRKGGPAAVSNLLRLCPNCHWLYDHKGLTAEELDKLEEIITQRRQAG